MTARYRQNIVIENEAGEPSVVVIYDEKTHTPVFFGVNKFDMDEVLELLGGQAPEVKKSDNFDVI